MRRPKVRKLAGGGYQVRWTDPDTGRDAHQNFERKAPADRYCAQVAKDILDGAYIDPQTARTTVTEWCDRWIVGYGTRRRSTVRQAETHLVRIKAHFGPMQLGSVKPSHVRSWAAALQAEGLAESYIYALHGRLSQVFADAVHDGIVARSPCSRRTSPPMAGQRAYVATTEQVWALHDAMAKHLRPAVLLAAFTGLRLAEVCGLRVSDVDFMRGIVHPAVQFPAEPLKTEVSRTAVPIPQSLAAQLSAHVATRQGPHLLTNRWGDQLSPRALEHAMRAARAKVPGLPDGFRFHDLRHYYASLLIHSGVDVKIVQTRMRHASARVTLDTYGHLWPDSDESTRSAISAVVEPRWDSGGTSILDQR